MIDSLYLMNEDISCSFLTNYLVIEWMRSQMRDQIIHVVFVWKCLYLMMYFWAIFDSQMFFFDKVFGE